MLFPLSLMTSKICQLPLRDPLRPYSPLYLRFSFRSVETKFMIRQQNICDSSFFISESLMKDGMRCLDRTQSEWGFAMI